jgi:hypothetical protein
VSTISSKTGGAAGSLEVGFVPQESWLAPNEGGNDDSSLLVRVNPTTFVVPSAAAPTTGRDAELEDPGSGLVHCFGQGTGSPGCKFIHLGSLNDERRPLRVNDSTVVIQGNGRDLEDCEVHGKPDPGLGFPVDIDTKPTCSSGSPTCNASGSVVCPSGGPTCAAGSARCVGNTPICEASESGRQAEAADDVLFVVKGLGSDGAFVHKVTVKRLSKLCLFAHSTDPIRVNDDTVVFVQPGPDRRFGISSGTRGTSGNALHCGAALDDEIWVVSNLTTSTKDKDDIEVKKIKVGQKLGVHLGGSAADRGVRLSDRLVVWASPGADGHFASHTQCTSEATPCGLPSPNAADDGLIVLDVKSNKLKFVTIGTIPGNSAGRPLRVNDTAVVLIGTGTDQERQEDVKFIRCTQNQPADDQIIVVEGLDTAVPTVTTLSGYGFMRRPVRLSHEAAVVFEENYFNATNQGGVTLNAHVIRGIGGSDSDFPGETSCVHISGPPSDTSLPVGTGHQFAETDLTRQDAGVVLNCDQLVFWTGPGGTDQQAFLLTNHASPPAIVASNTAAGNDWAGPRTTRINDSTILYTANVLQANVATRALGVLKAASDGTTLTDTRLTLPAAAQPPTSGGEQPEGLHIPSSAPVRLSDSKGVVLSPGADGIFSAQCSSASQDDGLIVITGLDTNSPSTSFVGSWGSCGAHGCRPIALGTPGSEVAVMAGPGANCDIGEVITNAPTCPSGGGTPSCSTGTLACVRGSAACITGSPTCTSGVAFCNQNASVRCSDASSPSCAVGSSAQCSGGLGTPPVCKKSVTCSSGSPSCPSDTDTVVCTGGSPTPSLTCSAGKDDDELIVVKGF